MGGEEKLPLIEVSLYDRMDILLTLHPVNLDQPAEMRETSEQIRKRVEKARERQYNRYQAEICNAQVPYEKLITTSPLTPSQKK